MTSRGRYNKSQDWDPMQDDFNDTTYDSQYPDEDAIGGVQLDHCKLYVTNISKALNEEGLHAAFAKYANNVRLFLSKDPVKRYAFVTFDTPGEAKHAMMKLNRTEPLRLIISVAHMKYSDSQRYNNYQASNRDHSGSGSSKGWNSRKQDEQNGDNGLDCSLDDEDLGLGDDFNNDVEMIELKHEYWCIQAAKLKCKERLLQLRAGKKSSQKPLSNMNVLPDGRIVVRNNNDRSPSDNVFNSAAGDSITTTCSCDRPWNEPTTSRSTLPPGDIKDKRHRCLTCDTPADSYCSRCGVAPYCSQKCQNVDWQKRHRSVCHNLARTHVAPEETKTLEPESIIKDPEPETKGSEPKTKGSEPKPKGPGLKANGPGQKANGPEPKIKESDVTTQSLRRPLSPSNRNMGREYKRNDEDRPRQNFHAAGQKVNRNQNFRNCGNLRRPNVQNYRNNQDEEEVFDLKAPQETTPTQEEKPQELPIRRPIQDPPMPKVETPKAEAPKVEAQPVSKASVANPPPVLKVLPTKYLLETLSPGDIALLSVDSAASACRGRSGFICLSVTENSESIYQTLCDDYCADCEKDEIYTPKPGDLFSYLNHEDLGWYRARCLNSTLAALIDSSKLVPLTTESICKKITAKYEAMPEFCCELDAKGVAIGDNLKCTIISKTRNSCKVSIENAATHASVGEGEISRWKPAVDVPASPVIPEIQRPDLKGDSRVVLVDCTSFDKAFVRPSDTESTKEYHRVLHHTLLGGRNATPIEEPPKKGQTVITKFQDGYHYRALVKRTNPSQNKYLLEYAEYGNLEICKKEDIFPCPPELSLEKEPTIVSRATLKVSTARLTPAATEYLHNIRDVEDELLLSLADGSKTAPSGSDINLTIMKNCESINMKCENLCTPGWKKLELSGGDVISMPRLMLSDLTYPALPRSGCELDVLDVTLLPMGAISACPRNPDLHSTLKKLSERMAEYCNSDLGKEPYLPTVEELCIAKGPPYKEWFRAALCEQVNGPGGTQLHVCNIDHGNMIAVPVSMVRKMMPEFVADIPCAALHVVIRGLPEDVPPEVMKKALLHMKIDEEGRGKLKVVNCEKVQSGYYNVDAPELLDAIKC